MWIVPPSIRLAFFLESGCLTKDCTPDLDSWASEAERSCSLNGKPTRSQSWKQGCKKAPYLMRLFGSAICANLTQASFQAWWIASLQASRAKTCHWQADAPGWMASAAGCSLKSPALPVVAVRDTSFWRTSQASLLPPPPLWTKPKALLTNAQPPASWENWPTSGGMRNGQLFQRPTLEPATGARGGFAGHGEKWTTPQCHDVTERGSGQQPTAKAGNACLARDARQWATPTSNEHTGAGHPDSKQGTMNLRSQAVTWATPDCNTSTYSNGKMGPNIREQAAAWPTPASRDYRTPNSKTLEERGGGTKGEQLPNYVEHHFSPQDQPTPPGQESSSTGPTSPRRLPVSLVQPD